MGYPRVPRFRSGSDSRFWAGRERARCFYFLFNPEGCLVSRLHCGPDHLPPVIVGRDLSGVELSVCPSPFGF